MKIRAVNIAEIVLYLIFVVTTILTKQHIARLGFVAIPAFMILGGLYFPFGFYTIRSISINVTYASVYGALFGYALSAIFFRILRTSFTVPLLLAFIVIFLAIAVIGIFSGSFSKQAGKKLIQWDVPTVIRYAVLFITLAVALATYF